MSTITLERVTAWVIKRKCKRDDNIHIKRAVKDQRTLLNITGWDKDKLIDLSVLCLIDMELVDKIEEIKYKFAYVASILYKTIYPKLLDNFTQEYILKLEEAENQR